MVGNYKNRRFENLNTLQKLKDKILNLACGVSRDRTKGSKVKMKKKIQNLKYWEAGQKGLKRRVELRE